MFGGKGEEFDDDFEFDMGGDEFFSFDDSGPTADPPKGFKGYFTNAFKSVKNLSVDVGRAVLPDAFDVVESTKQASSELKSEFSERKDAFIQKHFVGGKLDLKNKIKDAGSEIKEVAKKSVKTGSFYNKEEASFDFGDDDWGDDDDSEGSGEIKSVKRERRNLKASSQIAQKSTRDTLEGIGNIQAAATNAQVAVTATGFATLNAVSEVYHKQIIQVLGTINNNLAKLVSLGNAQMTDFKAAMEFRAKNLAMQHDMLGILKEMHEVTMWKAGKDKKNENNLFNMDGSSAADIFGFGFNMDAYKNRIKENVKGMFDSSDVGQVYGAFKMMKDMQAEMGGPEKSLGAQGIDMFKSFLPNLMFSSGVRDQFEKANSAVAGIPAMMVSKFSQAAKTGGPLMQFLGGVLGIDDVVSKNAGLGMRESDLEKPVAFSKKVEKSITTVIPGYLSRILSALTGEEEDAFDYGSNTFKKRSFYKKENARAVEYDYVSDFNMSNALEAMNNKLGETKESNLDLFGSVSSSDIDKALKTMNKNLVNVRGVLDPALLRDKNYRDEIFKGIDDPKLVLLLSQGLTKLGGSTLSLYNSGVQVSATNVEKGIKDRAKLASTFGSDIFYAQDNLERELEADYARLNSFRNNKENFEKGSSQYLNAIKNRQAILETINYKAGGVVKAMNDPEKAIENMGKAGYTSFSNMGEGLSSIHDLLLKGIIVYPQELTDKRAKELFSISQFKDSKREEILKKHQDEIELFELEADERQKTAEEMRKTARERRLKGGNFVSGLQQKIIGSPINAIGDLISSSIIKGVGKISGVTANSDIYADYSEERMQEIKDYEASKDGLAGLAMAGMDQKQIDDLQKLLGKVKEEEKKKSKYHEDDDNDPYERDKDGNLIPLVDKEGKPMLNDIGLPMYKMKKRSAKRIDLSGRLYSTSLDEIKRRSAQQKYYDDLLKSGDEVLEARQAAIREKEEAEKALNATGEEKKEETTKQDFISAGIDALAEIGKGIKSGIKSGAKAAKDWTSYQFSDEGIQKNKEKLRNFTFDFQKNMKGLSKSSCIAMIGEFGLNEGYSLQKEMREYGFFPVKSIKEAEAFMVGKGATLSDEDIDYIEDPDNLIIQLGSYEEFLNYVRGGNFELQINHENKLKAKKDAEEHKDAITVSGPTFDEKYQDSDFKGLNISQGGEKVSVSSGLAEIVKKITESNDILRKIEFNTYVKGSIGRGGLSDITKGEISSDFGERNDPFTGRKQFHKGIDVAGKYGEPVKAAKDGKVVTVDYNHESYGKLVVIQHEDGTQSINAHLSSINVEPGDTVKKGEIIGKMGSSGNSTGPHLHFSVLNKNEVLNPKDWLKGKGGLFKRKQTKDDVELDGLLEKLKKKVSGKLKSSSSDTSTDQIMDEMMDDALLGKQPRMSKLTEFLDKTREKAKDIYERSEDYIDRKKKQISSKGLLEGLFGKGTKAKIDTVVEDIKKKKTKVKDKIKADGLMDTLFGEGASERLTKTTEAVKEATGEVAGKVKDKTSELLDKYDKEGRIKGGVNKLRGFIDEFKEKNKSSVQKFKDQMAAIKEKGFMRGVLGDENVQSLKDLKELGINTFNDAKGLAKQKIADVKEHGLIDGLFGVGTKQTAIDIKNQALDKAKAFKSWLTSDKTKEKARSLSRRLFDTGKAGAKFIGKTGLKAAKGGLKLAGKGALGALKYGSKGALWAAKKGLKYGTKGAWWATKNAAKLAGKGALGALKLGGKGAWWATKNAAKLAGKGALGLAKMPFKLGLGATKLAGRGALGLGKLTAKPVVGLAKGIASGASNLKGKFLELQEKRKQAKEDRKLRLEEAKNAKITAKAALRKEKEDKVNRKKDEKHQKEVEKRLAGIESKTGSGGGIGGSLKALGYKAAATAGAAALAYGGYKVAKAASYKIQTVKTELSSPKSTMSDKLKFFMGDDSGSNFDAEGNRVNNANRGFGAGKMAGGVATTKALVGVTKWGAKGYTANSKLYGTFIKFVNKVLGPDSKIGKKIGAKSATALIKKITSKVGKSAFGKIAKKFAGLIGKLATPALGWALLIGQVMKDYASGLNNTARYFKLGKGAKPTIGMKMTSALVNVINGFLFGLIPVPELVKMIYGLIGDKKTLSDIETTKAFNSQRAKILGVDPGRLNEFETMTAWEKLFGGRKKAANLLGFDGSTSEGLKEYDNWYEQKYKPVDELYKSSADEANRSGFSTFKRFIDVLGLPKDDEEREYQATFRKSFLDSAKKLISGVKLDKTQLDKDKDAEGEVKPEVKEKNEEEERKKAESALADAKPDEEGKGGDASDNAALKVITKAERSQKLAVLQENIKKIMNKTKVGSFIYNTAAKVGTGIKSAYNTVKGWMGFNTEEQNKKREAGASLEFKEGENFLPAQGNISSYFGPRPDPFGSGAQQTHRGIDIANKAGTPIYAVQDAEVVAVDYNHKLLGKMVALKHGDGTYSVNAHLSEINVEKGQKVKKGDEIGLMGNTGASTGPHLHYSVIKDGKLVDPYRWIGQNFKIDTDSKDPTVASPLTDFYVNATNMKAQDIPKEKKEASPELKSGGSLKMSPGSTEFKGKLSEKEQAQQNIQLEIAKSVQAGKGGPEDDRIIEILTTINENIEKMVNINGKVVENKKSVNIVEKKGKNDLSNMVNEIVEINNKIHEEQKRHNQIAEHFYGFMENAFGQFMVEFLKQSGFKNDFNIPKYEPPRNNSNSNYRPKSSGYDATKIASGK